MAVSVALVLAMKVINMPKNKIRFEEVESEDDYRIFNVYNRRKELLGYISWHKPWKRYVFEPCHLTIHSSECLDIISEFLMNLEKNR